MFEIDRFLMLFDMLMCICMCVFHFQLFVVVVNFDEDLLYRIHSFNAELNTLIYLLVDHTHTHTSLMIMMMMMDLLHHFVVIIIFFSSFLMKEKFRENLSPECRRLLFVIDGWILLMMMENSFFCIETKKKWKMMAYTAVTE